MAFEMPAQSASGTVHTTAYWRPGVVLIDPVRRSATVVFKAWESQAALLSGHEAIAGPQHSYEVAGDAFLALYQAIVTGSTNFFALIYATARAIADTPDGQGGLVSFFATARDV